MAITKNINTRIAVDDCRNKVTYEGLSTDSKPTTNVGTNDEFKELDTGKTYYFNGSAWAEGVGGGGGGGGGTQIVFELDAVDPTDPDMENWVVTTPTDIKLNDMLDLLVQDPASVILVLNVYSSATQKYRVPLRMVSEVIWGDAIITAYFGTTYTFNGNTNLIQTTSLTATGGYVTGFKIEIIPLTTA